ncbi:MULTISPECIES: hypothetical protein [unclassified Nodularia (in: cyanobacteria)]|nr:hypothetical protein [Nodularia sp. LEGE 04288]MCC2692220.1 hypothetical protein [Nodularia sp. LEGE 04288]
MEEYHQNFINEIDNELEELGLTDANDVTKAFHLRQRHRASTKNNVENNF